MISGGEAAPQPLRVMSGGQTDLGTVAVLIFFVISGYLITQSYDRSPQPWRFLKARVLRIFPGLLLAIFLTAAVLGPTVTSVPIAAYFNDRATASYVPINLSLARMQDSLPGVFADNPLPNRLNNSIWTLQYEFVMYLGVLLLGMTRMLNRYVVVMLWVGCAALTWRWIGGWYTHFAMVFLSGSMLYFWRDRVPLDWRLATLSVVPLTAALLYGEFRLAFVTCGAYLVIFLAIARTVRLPNLARYGDLSYGIYVFAFPIQQTVAHALRGAVTWYWDVAISLPITLLLAWLSWQLVEQPALSLRQSSRHIAEPAH